MPELPQAPHFEGLPQSVAIAPLPVGFNMGFGPQLPTGEGPFVLMTLSTPAGSTIYWLPVDFVDTIVDALRQTQAHARGGLVVAPAGLVLPGLPPRGG